MLSKKAASLRPLSHHQSHPNVSSGHHKHDRNNREQSNHAYYQIFSYHPNVSSGHYSNTEYQNTRPMISTSDSFAVSSSRLKLRIVSIPPGLRYSCFIRFSLSSPPSGLGDRIKLSINYALIIRVYCNGCPVGITGSMLSPVAGKQRTPEPSLLAPTRRNVAFENLSLKPL